MNVKALILAGGSGTRFWPKSTEEKPKQFLNITSDDKTMIQETFSRALKITSHENIYVVTNEKQAHHIFEQLDLTKSNVIMEPAAKNTAAAIALGILKMNEDDVVIVLPSDHYIKDVNKYVKILETAAEFANKNEAIVTLGIKPTRAETGYGYIEVNKDAIAGLTRNLDSFKKPIPLKVERFHEKPNLETAYSYVESGNFFWNSGMFIFKVSTMWKAFKKHMPTLHKALKNVKSREELEKAYSTLDSVSIDYGVMEKFENVFVIPGDFGWNDVGSWDAVYELVEKDENGNYSSSEKTIFRNAKNCAVFADGKEVAIAHVDDIIVVVHGNKVLVIKRGTTQDVKNLRKSRN